MLKFYCDICQKECNDPDFIFDATIMENKEVFDLTNPKINGASHKVPSKRQIQICRGCYEKNIKSLLK